MDDLYAVGPDKPLGYLPISSIYMHGEHPDAVARLSEQRGLSVVRPEQGDEPVLKGDLYVYDALALGHLLKGQAATLTRRGWPTEPADFVERLRQGTVDQKKTPDLFRVVAWAFRDPRPEYQRPAATESATAAPQTRLRRALRIGSLGLKK
jgi:hypothetical protein